MDGGVGDGGARGGEKEEEGKVEWQSVCVWGGGGVGGEEWGE